MTQAGLIYCAIYCRISEDREGAGLGVDRQEEDCRKLAAALGLIVVMVYTDNDVSAYKARKKKPRKGYRRMLADAEAGRFSVILSWHTDRLHRSPLELEEYIDVCNPADIPTYTVKAGNLDLSTAAGRMVARVLGAQARYQSEHMSEQLIRKRKQLVDTGKSPGGPRPFGFEADGITHRETEAEEIRKGTKGVIGGQSLGSQVRDLTERGFKTSAGTAWSVTKWRNVLLRPRNAGILVYHGKEAGEAPWAAIVDELEWRQMRAVLADPARRKAQSNRVASLGSGLYRCGICGGPMRMSTSGKGSKVRGYRCVDHGHLTQAAKPVDAYVLHRLGAMIKRPEFVDAIVRSIQQGTGRPDPGRIEAANGRLAELGEMFAAGEIDGRTLKTATEKLRAQIAEAEKELVKSTIPASKWNDIVEDLLEMTADPENYLEYSGLDVQRTWLSAWATVTIMPATTRGSRFDPGRVKFEWTGAAKDIMSSPPNLVPGKLPDGTIVYTVKGVS